MTNNVNKVKILWKRGGFTGSELMHLKKEIRVYDDDDAKAALSCQLRAAVIVVRKLISIQLRRKLSWISI